MQKTFVRFESDHGPSSRFEADRDEDPKKKRPQPLSTGIDKLLSHALTQTRRRAGAARH
jgi:hypothetical protein